MGKRERDQLDIMLLDDKERCGEFAGGEMIGGFQVFKQAKRKTTRQMGFVSFYLPEDWVNPFMQASVGQEPDFNILLIKLPVDKESK